jgi:hypothetical protein
MKPIPDKRKESRVSFEKGVPVHIVAIDGTWQRRCKMADASDSGALLEVEGSLVGLDAKEFFLMLAVSGIAYRRCETAWVNGTQLGVNFLKPIAEPKKILGKRPDARKRAMEKPFEV